MDIDATLIIVMLSFAVFMVMMKSLYFDPIRQVKEQREAKMLADEKNAQAFAGELDQLSLEYEQSILAARKDAQKMLTDLRREAKASADETVKSAKDDANVALEKQMAELAQWREEAYQQLSSERQNITQLIVQKITAGKVPAASHS